MFNSSNLPTFAAYIGVFSGRDNLREQSNFSTAMDTWGSWDSGNSRDSWDAYEDAEAECAAAGLVNPYAIKVEQADNFYPKDPKVFVSKPRVSKSLVEKKNVRLRGPPNKCGICGFEVRCIDAMKTHLQRHLRTQQKNEEKRKDGKMWERSCRVCGKTFYDAFAFKNHRTTKHPDDRSVKCEHCGLMLKHARSLYKHRVRNRPCLEWFQEQKKKINGI